MSPRQWQEWQAFDVVCGIEREEDTANAVALFAVAVTRWLGYRFGLKQFVPRLVHEKPQTASQMRSNFEQLVTLHNASLQG